MFKAKGVYEKDGVKSLVFKITGLRRLDDEDCVGDLGELYV